MALVGALLKRSLTSVKAEPVCVKSFPPGELSSKTVPLSKPYLALILFVEICAFIKPLINSDNKSIFFFINNSFNLFVK